MAERPEEEFTAQEAANGAFESLARWSRKICAATGRYRSECVPEMRAADRYMGAARWLLSHRGIHRVVVDPKGDVAVMWSGQ